VFSPGFWVASGGPSNQLFSIYLVFASTGNQLNPLNRIIKIPATGNPVCISIAAFLLATFNISVHGNERQCQLSSSRSGEMKTDHHYNSERTVLVASLAPKERNEVLPCVAWRRVAWIERKTCKVTRKVHMKRKRTRRRGRNGIWNAHDLIWEFAALKLVRMSSTVFVCIAMLVSCKPLQLHPMPVTRKQRTGGLDKNVFHMSVVFFDVNVSFPAESEELIKRLKLLWFILHHRHLPYQLCALQ
jgi:hypothetical protein